MSLVPISTLNPLNTSGNEKFCDIFTGSKKNKWLGIGKETSYDFCLNQTNFLFYFENLGHFSSECLGYISCNKNFLPAKILAIFALTQTAITRSKLTIESGTSGVVMVSSFIILNIFHILFCCFYC